MTETLPHPVQLSQLRLRSILAGSDLTNGWPLALTARANDAAEELNLVRHTHGAPDRTVTIPYSHLLTLARLESDHPARAPVAPTPLHVPAAPKFGGKTFDPEKDEVRLSKQLQAVFNIMADGRWRTLEQLHHNLTAMGPPVPTLAGVSARLRDLRKPHHGGHDVKREQVEGSPGLWRYRLVVKAP